MDYTSFEVISPKNTSFKEVYDIFTSAISDDMYLELTKEDTYKMLEELLIAALPHFEFPDWEDPFDINLDKKEFTTRLTIEEKTIIKHYMILEWISQQLASIDLIRQKYSSQDFKFSSQASHMKQLLAMKSDYEREGFHLQRLYCRRKKDKNGRYKSTMSLIMEPL